MAAREFKNRLNDLTNKDWLKFQKSWFVHNPPPRRKDLRRHPAKFPETLVQEFIEFFTKGNQTIFDPMAGTGSSLVAALRAGRNSYGIELNPVYTKIAQEFIQDEREALGSEVLDLKAKIITGDSRKLHQLIPENDIPPIDYVITSPPYWDMLHAKGSESQRKRRKEPLQDVIYSENSNDLGNIHDYKDFIETLSDIYVNIKPFIKEKAYLTIIVKNVKKGGAIYPLAWDLARELSKTYVMKDEKIWCQDNQRLAPYGMGNAWVSNTFHHYCLQFRNE